MTDALIEETTEGDRLIFVGRSPLYVADALEATGIKRQIHRIAFSASFFGNHDPFPTEERAFREYLTDEGITPESLYHTPGRIVLVDLVYRGRTLRAFAEILNTWSLTQGLSIHEKLRSFDIKLPTMSFSRAHKITNSHSLGSFYPPSQWPHTRPTRVLSPEIQRRRRQLADYMSHRHGRD